MTSDRCTLTHMPSRTWSVVLWTYCILFNQNVILLSIYHSYHECMDSSYKLRNHSYNSYLSTSIKNYPSHGHKFWPQGRFRHGLYIIIYSGIISLALWLATMHLINFLVACLLDYILSKCNTSYDIDLVISLRYIIVDRMIVPLKLKNCDEDCMLYFYILTLPPMLKAHYF